MPTESDKVEPSEHELRAATHLAEADAQESSFAVPTPLSAPEGDQRPEAR